MSLKRNSNSLFLQDKEIRNQLNNLSPSTLWDLLFLNESYMTLKTNIIENLKEIYLDQDIKHEGISKDQYLKHPLRMVYFTKRYFPKSFSRIYKLILFHNILEVCNINDKVTHYTALRRYLITRSSVGKVAYRTHKCPQIPPHV